MSLTQVGIKPSIHYIHVKELSAKYGKVEVIAEQSLELWPYQVWTSSWLMVRYVNRLYEALPTLSCRLLETVESSGAKRKCSLFMYFNIFYRLQYLLFEGGVLVTIVDSSVQVGLLWWFYLDFWAFFQLVKMGDQLVALLRPANHLRLF